MRTILIIEDDDSIRESVVEILDVEGFKVFAGANGLEGVQLAKKHLPDLIICDIMMPVLDGYGVLTELQKNQNTSTIPFIFLTAKADKKDVRKGMQLGADDYLNKPFTIDELLTAINIRLNKHTTIKQKSEERLDALRASISMSLPHELNTPLSGIIGFAEMLKQEIDTLDREEITEMASHIHEASIRLKKTVQRILFYARLQILNYNQEELQDLKENFTPVSSEYFENMLIDEDYGRNPRSEDFTFNIHEADVKIQEEYFRSALNEIYDNCIKFTDPSTKIIISGRKNEDSYRLEVRDKGRGMSQEQITSIGAFMQFDRKIYEQQGSGLGLTVANQTIKLFDGDFTIESEIGKGTAVIITLPLYA